MRLHCNEVKQLRSHILAKGEDEGTGSVGVSEVTSPPSAMDEVAMDEGSGSAGFSEGTSPPSTMDEGSGLVGFSEGTSPPSADSVPAMDEGSGSVGFSEGISPPSVVPASVPAVDEGSGSVGFSRPSAPAGPSRSTSCFSGMSPIRSYVVLRNQTNETIISCSKRFLKGQ
jgi:hypothetical protein